MIENGRRVRFGHYQRKNYFKFRVSGKSADFPETHFHGRGRRGNRHLQRRFLRKCGAAVSVLALSVFASQIHLSQRERPWQSTQSYRFRQRLSLWESCHRRLLRGRGRSSKALPSNQKRAAAECSSPVKVCVLLRSRMRCGGRAARHGCSGCR